jgi:hypothetical protein
VIVAIPLGPLQLTIGPIGVLILLVLIGVFLSVALSPAGTRSRTRYVESPLERVTSRHARTEVDVSILRSRIWSLEARLEEAEGEIEELRRGQGGGPPFPPPGR